MAAKSARTVVKAALRVLSVDIPQVDQSYQRDVKKKVGKIVTEFNEEALGIPLVGEREDGSLWIVDGLQRITALRKMNRKEVRCEVFASKGPEHEAEVFKLVNMNRTRLSAHEEFKALLTAQDKAAWELKTAVEAVGFRIVEGKSGNSSEAARSRDITCVNTLRTAAKEQGIDAVKFALSVIDEAWPEDPLAVYNVIVGGISLFWSKHDGIVDREKLVARMQTTSPQKLMSAASQLTLGNSKLSAIADVMERVYRKRLSSKRGS